MNHKLTGRTRQSDADPRFTRLFGLARQALDILEDLSRVPRPLQETPKYERKPIPPQHDDRPAQSDRMSYSIKETAVLIGVGRSTIYRMIKDGELRAVKSGRRTIVLASDLNRWIENLKPV